MESADPAQQRSLYRKYRSRSFADIVGQAHVKQTLRNAVRSGTVGHAYLFTGTRGTGKTSVARILARAVNCLDPRDGEPCEQCTACVATRGNCLDIVEIDAASHGSVDDARELRGQATLAPMTVRRKVYIIDEAHMLSAQANDALLKVLEEPPPHVMFILATTDVHKIKITVASRCQRLDFRPISLQDITDRLAYVCAHEGLAAEREALALLAGQAGGSLRDALSLLEQVRAYEHQDIRSSDVQEALGLARSITLAQLTDAIIDGDAGRALGLIDEVAASGVDLRQYTKQLLQYWRDLLLYAAGSAAHVPADPALAAQAARLTVQDVTGILTSLLQPDTRERTGAPVRWQLELAVAQACQHFAGSAPVPTRKETAQMAGMAASSRQTGVVQPAVQATVVQPAIEEVSRPAGPPIASPDGQAATVTQRADTVAPDDLTPVQEIATTGLATSGDRGDTPRVAETRADVTAIWAEALKTLSEMSGHMRVVTTLKAACQPVGLDGDTFVLGLQPGQPAFFKGQIETSRQIIEEVLGRLLGKPVALRCETLGAASTAGATRPTEKAESFVQRAERAILSVHMDRGSR